MATLGKVEEYTKDFSEKRRLLCHRVSELEAELDAVRRRYLPAIKTAADDVTEAQALLHQAIEESPGLFEKPKTMVIAGVRVGFKKERGEIVFEDEATVIRLIRKHLPDQAEHLIKTTERVLKNALAQLSGAELKKVGAEVRADTDAVVIKPTDTEIDKLVAAILKEGERLLEEVA